MSDLPKTPGQILHRNLFAGLVGWFALTFVQIIELASGKLQNTILIMSIEVAFVPFIAWMTWNQATRAARLEEPNDRKDIQFPATVCGFLWIPIYTLMRLSF